MSSIGHNGGPSMVWGPFEYQAYFDGTRHLTLEQRGAYIDMICLQMMEMKPVRDDYKWLGHRLHISSRKARTLVDQLVDFGKIKRLDTGLSNERCEMEIERYVAKVKQAKAAVKARWDKADKRDGSEPEKARNSRETSVKHPRKPDENPKNVNNINGPHNTSVIPYKNKIEDKEREEKKDTPLSPPKGADLIDEKFQEFWKAFPPSNRKTGKGETLALFRLAVTGQRQKGQKRRKKVEDHERPSADQLVDAVKAYAATKPDPEYTPSPRTWLNQGRWLDETEPAQTDPWWVYPENVAAVTDTQWRNSIEKYANGMWPVDRLSPPPGSPDCKVPRHLVKELRLEEKYTSGGLLR